MARFLANENVPKTAIDAARKSVIEIDWILEREPGASDERVLAIALAEERILISYDTDFGELVFKRGINASCGIILLRPHLQTPEAQAAILLAVFSRPIDWRGNFSVVREGLLRVVPLA